MYNIHITTSQLGYLKAFYPITSFLDITNLSEPTVLYLSDRFHFLNVNDESSIYLRVMVLQVSVCGYLKEQPINFLCHSDDIQLYRSLKPEPKQTSTLTKFQTCLKDINLDDLHSFAAKHRQN